MELFAYTGGRPFDATRPTVVFIHGAQHDHSVWILQSRYLAHHGFNALAFDLPGHGRSLGPACRSVQAYADAVFAALATRNVKNMMLVGHSMGSLIALEVARRLPERVAGIALIGTAAPMKVSDALLAATRDDPRAAMDMINVWSHAAGIAPFAARPGNPGPGFNIVWQNLRLMQRIEREHGPNTLIADFVACNAYAAGLDAAAALRCPALFVLGAADQMTPPKAASALIDAVTTPKTVVTLERTGHAMMAENPEGVREALVAFATRLLSASSALDRSGQC
jgi:pimeloyl-ACP methyl ester carboxylesterase